jgi:hypothetical protein
MTGPLINQVFRKKRQWLFFLWTYLYTQSPLCVQLHHLRQQCFWQCTDAGVTVTDPFSWTVGYVHAEKRSKCLFFLNTWFISNVHTWGNSMFLKAFKICFFQITVFIFMLLAHKHNYIIIQIWIILSSS